MSWNLTIEDSFRVGYAVKLYRLSNITGGNENRSIQAGKLSRLVENLAMLRCKDLKNDFTWYDFQEYDETRGYARLVFSWDVDDLVQGFYDRM